MNRIGVIGVVSSGTSIEQAVADAMALSAVESQADKAVRFVRFDFNEVQIEVTPYSDPARIVAAYQAVRGQDGAKVPPHP